jgi:uncharacterized membrane protein YfcA
MFPDGTLVAVLAVVFLATLVRSAFGFGEALVAVPLLALVIPDEVAAPLAVLLSVTVAVVILVQDWHRVHFHSAWRLVFSTLFGLPLGLWLLAAAPEPVVKATLAVVIIAFSAYCLARRRPFELHDDRLAWAFGLAAGVLGGAYGMNGPPLVVYGALRRWPPEHFRATLQGYFLPASLLGLAGYWLGGLWAPPVTRYYLLSLPLAAGAIFLGGVLNRRLKGDSFVFYVHLGLIVIGAVLLLQVAGRFLPRLRGDAVGALPAQVRPGAHRRAVRSPNHLAAANALSTSARRLSSSQLVRWSSGA